jgi:hypothetical protein
MFSDIDNVNSSNSIPPSSFGSPSSSNNGPSGNPPAPFDLNKKSTASNDEPKATSNPSTMHNFYKLVIESVSKTIIAQQEAGTHKIDENLKKMEQDSKG